jgi:hypothetical protein
MCKCAGVDEEFDQEEQNHTLSQRGLNSLDSIVVRTEDQNSQDDIVRDLNNDVGQDEGLPGVCFARSFTNLVKRTLVDEERHNLDEWSGRSTERTKIYIPAEPEKRRLCRP